MNPKIILSALVALLVAGGLGYGIYISTGKIVHEALLLEGQTIRVAGVTQRKVLNQYPEHSFTLPAGQGHLILLEGRFPPPTRSTNAYNRYHIRIVDGDGSVLFDEQVSQRFSKNKDSEGLQELLKDFFPGKTAIRVTAIEAAPQDRQVTITFSRQRSDSIANKLFLRIREKR